MANQTINDVPGDLLEGSVCKRCNGSGCIDNLRPVGAPAMDCPCCKVTPEEQALLDAGTTLQHEAFTKLAATVHALKNSHKLRTAELAALRETLERIRLTVFDERATVYSDAPGYIQDIRDILEDEATNG